MEKETNPSQNNYQVCQASSRDDLSIEVDHMMRQGFVPQGSMVILQLTMTTLYTQPVVRLTSSPPDTGPK